MKLKSLWIMAKAKITGHFNYYGYWMNNLKLNHASQEKEHDSMEDLFRDITLRPDSTKQFVRFPVALFLNLLVSIYGKKKTALPVKSQLETTEKAVKPPPLSSFITLR